MNTEWSVPAWSAGVEAAGEAAGGGARKWAGQADYDREWMKTESTRFPLDLHQKLEAYCREAGVTRYHLINYMLRVWMAAWEGVRNGRGTGAMP